MLSNSLGPFEIVVFRIRQKVCGSVENVLCSLDHVHLVVKGVDCFVGCVEFVEGLFMQLLCLVRVGIL